MIWKQAGMANCYEPGQLDRTAQRHAVCKVSERRQVCQVAISYSIREMTGADVRVAGVGAHLWSAG